MGDFQTIQHTDKHIVIFNQNASHRASLLKKRCQKDFFATNAFSERAGGADQTVNLQGILETFLPPPSVPKQILPVLTIATERRGVFQHICIVWLQNKKGI